MSGERVKNVFIYLTVHMTVTTQWPVCKTACTKPATVESLHNAHYVFLIIEKFSHIYFPWT